VCREQSVDELGEIEHRITIVPNATDDREIKRAVTGCDGWVKDDAVRRRR
jgi:hypothetical protein